MGPATQSQPQAGFHGIFTTDFTDILDYTDGRPALSAHHPRAHPPGYLPIRVIQNIREIRGSKNPEPA
jgi:hypothetical protein